VIIHGMLLDITWGKGATHLGVQVTHYG